MLFEHPLSRSTQLLLNSKALLQDAARRDFGKMGFHLRGLWRALLVF